MYCAFRKTKNVEYLPFLDLVKQILYIYIYIANGKFSGLLGHVHVMVTS